MRRVVITGLGMVTPLGIGVEANWRRLINGESGIGAIGTFDVSDLPSRIAGQVPRGEAGSGRWHPADFVPAKEVRKNDEFILFAMAAAREAIEDAGWTPEDDA